MSSQVDCDFLKLVTGVRFRFVVGARRFNPGRREK